MSITADSQIQWTMASRAPNPGPEVPRRVQITAPPDQVDPGSERWSEAPWPVGATAGPPHVAHVQPTSAASTSFQATLSIPSEPTFSPQSATVMVTDQRQAWFRSNITHTVAYVQGSESRYFNPGSTTPITYVSGQVSISPRTLLSGPNPSLPVYATATITRNGTAVPGLPTTRLGFPLHDTNLSVGSVTLLESTPPPTTPDRVVVTTQYFAGPTAPAPFHTATETVLITASPSVAPGAEARTLTADNAWITATLVPYMQRPAAPAHQRGIAGLVAATPPRIHLESMVIRADSVAEVTRRGGNPATQAAWYLGNTSRTVLLGPGAGGVQDPSIPDFVFVNRTTNLAMSTTRSVDELANNAGHEGIHVADTQLGPHDAWDEYKREFRAYWMEGVVGAGPPTDQMASAPPSGPRSERANAIFRHLYGNDAYPYVRPAYDANTEGFREKSNAMFHPDGVNLTLSVTLFDLQREVESYSGSGFAAKRTAIQTKYAACTTGDKAEVHTENQWRILVEAKFTDATERSQIKGDLGIP